VVWYELGPSWQTAEVEHVLAPRVEGTVTLPDGRFLGFAEFGRPGGRTVLWFHGTPGARRQLPPQLRHLALDRDVRLIGLERPGAGDSTPYFYDRVLDWADDVTVVLDHLGVDDYATIGLSGGGPYVLACAAAHPDRMVAGAVLGGVAPTTGPEAPEGGMIRLAQRFQSAIRLVRAPLGTAVGAMVQALRPVASPVFGLATRIFPEGDRAVFAVPEMETMFLEDIAHGSTRGLHAVFFDILLFSNPWGFDLADITVPIRFWQGDSDPIVPVAHAQRMAELVPDSALEIRHDESHLGALMIADEVLDVLLDLWPVARAA
jgi:pimeloyl-ACP methyl ester carboxylesterase